MSIFAIKREYDEEMGCYGNYNCNFMFFKGNGYIDKTPKKGGWYWVKYSGTILSKDRMLKEEINNLECVYVEKFKDSFIVNLNRNPIFLHEFETIYDDILWNGPVDPPPIYGFSNCSLCGEVFCCDKERWWCKYDVILCPNCSTTEEVAEYNRKKVEERIKINSEKVYSYLKEGSKRYGFTKRDRWKRYV